MQADESGAVHAVDEILSPDVVLENCDKTGILAEAPNDNLERRLPLPFLAGDPSGRASGLRSISEACRLWASIPIDACGAGALLGMPPAALE